MERRKYQKPSMLVIELKQQPQLLAGSYRSSATLNSTYSEEDWDNE